MAEDSDLAVGLKQLCVITRLFEEMAFEKGESFPLEHWEPQVGLELPVPGFVESRRIVQCLSFLANLYAGQVLDRQSLWQEFLSKEADEDFMPSFVYGRADTQHHRALHRLLRYHPSEARTGVQTGKVIEALARILGPGTQNQMQRTAKATPFDCACECFYTSSHFCAVKCSHTASCINNFFSEARNICHLTSVLLCRRPSFVRFGWVSHVAFTTLAGKKIRGALGRQRGSSFIVLASSMWQHQ